MRNLWAPWRQEFILGRKEKGCIFCKRLTKDDDRKNLILYRGKAAFVILNKYPYNSGHLMVVPNRHQRELEALTTGELTELMQLTQKCVQVLKKTFSPDGFNIGFNLGKTAGAGIDDHLHIHVVPRFTGDTNFLPVIGETKLQSVGLEEVLDFLAPRFKKAVKGKKAK
jgi:ATP adenylyltransferase